MLSSFLKSNLKFVEIIVIDFCCATLLIVTTFVSAYFSNTEFSVSERFGEAVQHLTGDSDTDVRAFFNPVEVSSNSEFYDSDGEPIADVSSLPV